MHAASECIFQGRSRGRVERLGPLALEVDGFERSEFRMSPDGMRDYARE
jgi:hypothetical protein